MIPVVLTFVGVARHRPYLILAGLLSPSKLGPMFCAPLVSESYESESLVIRRVKDAFGVRGSMTIVRHLGYLEVQMTPRPFPLVSPSGYHIHLLMSEDPEDLSDPVRLLRKYKGLIAKPLRKLL